MKIKKINKTKFQLTLSPKEAECLTFLLGSDITVPAAFEDPGNKTWHKKYKKTYLKMSKKVEEMYEIIRNGKKTDI